ncbi:unnamed protein product [Rotaria sp. Silwood2]|nr:unnamed protein product [Rotaria sp. Silwood2]
MIQLMLKDKILNLYIQIQDEFLNEFICYNEKQQRKRDVDITFLSSDLKIVQKQLQKASALYYIAYTEENEDNHDYLIKSKSFTWIMWNFLCKIRLCKQCIHHLSSSTIFKSCKSYYTIMANVKSRHVSNY